MQDSILKALHTSNDAGNCEANHCPPPAKQPSISLLEQNLRVRIEIFSLDAQEVLSYSAQADLPTLQEQLELQLDQLHHFINELQWVQWLKQNKPVFAQG